MSDRELPLRLAVGGDHAGFPLKELIMERFAGRVIELIDCGAFDESPCDYPDIAVEVAERINSGQADRGLMVCGSGVGVSVAANKITGIRAGVCHDTYSAHQGVEHDDMNVLCIGARVVGRELAFELIDAFLTANYTAEERHERRLQKILALEAD